MCIRDSTITIRSYLLLLTSNCIKILNRTPTIPFDFCLHTCEFLEKRGLKDKEARGFRDEMVSLASTSKNCYSFVTTQFTQQTVINSFVKIFSLGSSSHVSSFYYQSLWKCCDKLKNWYVYQLAFIYN